MDQEDCVPYQVLDNVLVRQLPHTFCICGSEILVPLPPEPPAGKTRILVGSHYRAVSFRTLGSVRLVRLQ